MLIAIHPRNFRINPQKYGFRDLFLIKMNNFLLVLIYFKIPTIFLYFILINPLLIKLQLSTSLRLHQLQKIILWQQLQQQPLSLLFRHLNHQMAVMITTNCGILRGTLAIMDSRPLDTENLLLYISHVCATVIQPLRLSALFNIIPLK